MKFLQIITVNCISPLRFEAINVWLLTSNWIISEKFYHICFNCGPRSRQDTVFVFQWNTHENHHVFLCTVDMVPVFRTRKMWIKEWFTHTSLQRSAKINHTRNSCLWMFFNSSESIGKEGLQEKDYGISETKTSK